MPIRAIATAALGLALCAPLHAITIDGRLDEPQWAGAQRVDDFRVVQPLTLEEPELRTELLVHSDERGLYFGMRMQQPPEVPRTRHRTARDAQARADRVNVIVDFDGRGSTAYEFTVSISGGIQDAIINNQRSFSYDWDGLWFHAVHEGEDYWSVEIHLPWAVAPMGPVVDGKREIGVYASRVVEGQGQRFSWPAYDFDRPTFVADMGRLRVDAWNRASLDLLPYVSYSHDRLGVTTRRAPASTCSGGRRAVTSSARPCSRISARSRATTWSSTSAPSRPFSRRSGPSSPRTSRCSTWAPASAVAWSTPAASVPPPMPVRRAAARSPER